MDEFESPWAGARPLAGKTALVTGAAGGIGHGIAEELTAAGAKVIRADLELGGTDGVRLDVTDPTSADRYFRNESVDVLVNAAGVLSVSPVVELDVEDWDRVMAVNARG